jgi:TPR repeat protein
VGGGGGGGRLEAERQRALALFRRAARLGSAAAMVDAGLMCWEEGRREEAVEYYRSAAELGHPVGMCNLGVSYLEGTVDLAVSVLGRLVRDGTG